VAEPNGDVGGEESGESTSGSLSSTMLKLSGITAAQSVHVPSARNRADYQRSIAKSTGIQYLPGPNLSGLLANARHIEEYDDKLTCVFEM
jgi:hypothetical protein